MASLRCAILIVALGCSVAPPAHAQDAMDIIALPSLSFPGDVFTSFLPTPEEGTPAAVFGMLRMPAGSERVPAVVLMHGCGGVSGAETYWARRLRDAGIATFLVNSFSGRDATRVCMGAPSISVASVLTDAYRALARVAALPRIDASRIALMGFSFGARTTLWANHPRVQERFGAGAPRFAAHLAFYPPCYIRLPDESRGGLAPVRIFHGLSDDWTPVGPCRDYVARLRAAGTDAAVFEYPGARHSFDNDQLPPNLALAGVANLGRCAFVERDGTLVDESGARAGFDSPCVVRNATIGYSHEARRQADADVHDFLRTVFRMP